MKRTINGGWVGYFSMRQRIAIALLLASSTMLAQMPATESGGGMSSVAAVKRTPYYVDPVLLDLSRILPLPPTQDSETTKQELALCTRLNRHARRNRWRRLRQTTRKRAYSSTWV